jgi:hypothetical protein
MDENKIKGNCFSHQQVSVNKFVEAAFIRCVSVFFLNKFLGLQPFSKHFSFYHFLL